MGAAAAGALRQAGSWSCPSSDEPVSWRMARRSSRVDSSSLCALSARAILYRTSLLGPALSSWASRATFRRRASSIAAIAAALWVAVERREDVVDFTDPATLGVTMAELVCRWCPLRPVLLLYRCDSGTVTVAVAVVLSLTVAASAVGVVDCPVGLITF